jgi:hypothetical protein
VLLLHWGFPLLLRVRVGRAAGLAGQRGVALALLLLLCTAFLVADRARYAALQHAPLLSEQDSLIQVLAADLQQAEQQAQQQAKATAPAASATPTTPQSPGAGLVTPELVTQEQKARSGPRIASQWPGRTMIACRCNTLPLPPASDDPVRFAANLRGIRYVLFDPRDRVNQPLAQNFAQLGGAAAETVALQAGGVLLRLRSDPVAEHAPAPDPGAAEDGGN